MIVCESLSKMVINTSYLFGVFRFCSFSSVDIVQ